MKHIISSYQKHHSPSQDVIYEDAENYSPITIVKPLSGIEANHMNPIIKENKNDEIKVPPLELSPNDYINFLARRFPEDSVIPEVESGIEKPA